MSNEIEGIIEVQTTNDTEIDYNTNDNPDLEASIDTKQISEIEASIGLRLVGDLESEISVIAHRNADLQSSLIPQSLNEGVLPASIDVYTNQETDTEITYTAVEPPDLEALIEVVHTSAIKGSIDVPVTFNEKLESNKDTFIDVDKPTLNFGDYQTLSIGEQDRYRTLIGFDVENLDLTENAIIRSATLNLKSVKTSQLNIEVLRLKEDWREHDTTWLNAPETAFESVATFKPEDRTKVDITELVQKWISGEVENYGILLKATTTVNEGQRYYSREYSTENDRPQLEVNYYDPDILAYNDANELTGSLTIPEANELLSSLEVDRGNEPDLKANIDVVHSDENELESSLSIANDNVEDFPAQIKISQPDLAAKLIVPAESDLEGSIEIKANADNDLDSILRIRREEIRANIDLKIHENLTASITVQADDNNNIVGTLHVNRDELKSNINVPERDNIDSQLTIRQEGSKDINGQGYISRKEIISNINVPERDEINANITVRESSNNELDSEIKVSNPDLEAKIELVIASSLDSKITVRETITEDINANITIKQDTENDLRSQIIPRIFNVSEINSTIEVENKSMLTLDITAKIDIRSKIPRVPKERPRGWKKDPKRWWER
ncbi:MAG: DNRLRE domain-containing protein [archaeon]